MSNQSLQLWQQFKAELKKKTSLMSFERFETAWKSRSNRTVYYFDHLLPEIANALGLGFKKEKTFLVDGIMYLKASQETEVPKIFIESENNIHCSNEEVYKLCSLNAPLKILFLCHEWTPETSQQIAEWYWDYIIGDIKEENGLIGYLAIIVAEWNESLKFHSYVYDNNAIVIEKEEFITLYQLLIE